MATYIETHAADIRQRFALLLRVDFGSPIYWTDYDVPIVTTGIGLASNTWTPKQFKVSGIDSQHGVVSGQATIEMGNADNAISSLILGGGLIGTKVYIYVAYLDPDAANSIAQAVKQIFGGVIDTVSMDSDAANASVVLSPLIDLQSKVLPRRVIGTKCTLDFKGAACQYAGADTACLRTLADCTSKSNSINFTFGQFPVYVNV